MCRRGTFLNSPTFPARQPRGLSQVGLPVKSAVWQRIMVSLVDRAAATKPAR